MIQPLQHPVNQKLPDSRLIERLHHVVNAITKKPGQSFPQVFQKKASLEGFYRLVNNERVSFWPLLKAASDSTFSLSPKLDSKIRLAIHDTSTFTFQGDQPIDGLGEVINFRQRLYGHFCLEVTLDREIESILGVLPWIREADRKKKRTRKEIEADPNHERKRWGKLIHEVQQNNSDSNLIHVADREADDYLTLCELKDSQIRFVFRAAYNRTIFQDGEKDKLFNNAAEAAIVCEREVQLSSRKKKSVPGRGKANPARKSRIAKLGISAKKIEISRNASAPGKLIPSVLELNFVRVFELNPPDGEVPIEWLLITTEPIENQDDLLQIVDIYRTRWVIEEYFKALKTGCLFEKRGFESSHAILNTLAILAPIAAKIYNLKTLGRKDPERSSKELMTATQIKVLSQATQTSENVLNTIAGVMAAIAALGGHIKYNGPPGWQVLARGYETLLKLEHGWILAQQFNQNPLMHRNM